jgi:hypothetical protein
LFFSGGLTPALRAGASFLIGLIGWNLEKKRGQ